MRNCFRMAFCLLAGAAAACHPRAVSATSPLTTVRVASGLSRPLFVTSPPGDSTRIFIVEQWTGNIKIVKKGNLLARPFLTVPGLATTNEQGLLGLAFNPNYSSNGYFYIDCTRTNGATLLRRYKVSADPDRADSLSGTTLLTIAQPQDNHNGGWLAFGPDGYLYMGNGDGGNFGDQGSGHDPNIGNAQSDTTRLGKVLRLDVNGGFPYAIPPSNPFSGAASPRNEFWAKGVRNPWRCSFDRATGDLYIGDVGQDKWEEIDYQPAGAAGGRNYGWRKFEGYATYTCPGPCDSSGLTRPIFVYGHSGALSGCAVVGGYVYRGPAAPTYHGTYFFSDNCTSHIWTFVLSAGAVTQFTDLTMLLFPSSDGWDLGTVSSFGEDGRGELYICDLAPGTNNGQVFKILPLSALGVAPGANASGVRLAPARPNPGRRFTLDFMSSGLRRVRLAVYDLRGALVRMLLDDTLQAGAHHATWDGRDTQGRPAPSGSYVLKLDAGGEHRSEKITVLR